MAATDKQVQDLVKLVKTKKAEISKAEKPDWKTNCTFGYVPDSPQRINIQTVSDVNTLVSILAFLLVQQESYDKAHDILHGVVSINSPSKFKWQGFTVEEWQSDLQTRLNKIQITKKKNELDELETRLNKLVSPELRTQLELEEITNILSK
jgi:hypothetical protein